MNLLEALHKFAEALTQRGPQTDVSEAVEVLHEALQIFNPPAAVKLEEVAAVAETLDAIVNPPALQPAAPAP